MVVYIVVSLASGILFGILDGLINANPVAVGLYAVYKPIARSSLNVMGGILTDLVYGFLLAGIFLLLYTSLPGGNGLVKGVSYAVMVWFFRVVMYVASQWVMFNVPETALAYMLITGLMELLILGILYGLTLNPSSLGALSG
jgi:hypothetical protein